MVRAAEVLGRQVPFVYKGAIERPEFPSFVYKRRVTRAWRLYVSNWPVFAGAVVVLFLSWVLLEAAVVATQRLGIIAWALLHVLFLVSLGGLLAGFHRLALDAIDGRVPRFGDLFGSMDRGPTLLIATVAYLALVAIGLVLLVVPGLYVAARLSLLGQVIADRRLSPMAALLEAARITRGQSWAAARTMGTVILLNLVGAAVLGIGLLVALPVSVLTATAYYRSISLAEV